MVAHVDGNFMDPLPTSPQQARTSLLIPANVRDMPKKYNEKHKCMFLKGKRLPYPECYKNLIRQQFLCRVLSVLIAQRPILYSWKRRCLFTLFQRKGVHARKKPRC